MFSLFQRKRSIIEDLYGDILDQARQPKLYKDFMVPDTPIGRFHMIILHAMPHFIALGEAGRKREIQQLFDFIFQDIEYSFREIGVGDLSVPKKMKRYMKDFNGLIHAHTAEGADHVMITQRQIFDESEKMNTEFAQYIKDLF